jgi:hypothetical protein
MGKLHDHFQPEKDKDASWDIDNTEEFLSMPGNEKDW